MQYYNNLKWHNDDLFKQTNRYSEVFVNSIRLLDVHAVTQMKFETLVSVRLLKFNGVRQRYTNVSGGSRFEHFCRRTIVWRQITNRYQREIISLLVKNSLKMNKACLME